MEIEVIRRHFKDTYTIGRMLLDKTYFCDVLEDKVRDLKDINHDGDFDEEGEGKIYGETAVPCGRYEVIVSYSPKFMRRLPLLLDVEGFTYIRIHTGSTAKNTEGCILVGKNTKPGRLENGPYFETLLVQKIDEEAKKGKQSFITIKQ